MVVLDVLEGNMVCVSAIINTQSTFQCMLTRSLVTLAVAIHHHRERPVLGLHCYQAAFMDPFACSQSIERENTAAL